PTQQDRDNDLQSECAVYVPMYSAYLDLEDAYTSAYLVASAEMQTALANLNATMQDDPHGALYPCELGGQPLGTSVITQSAEPKPKDAKAAFIGAAQQDIDHD